MVGVGGQGGRSQEVLDLAGKAKMIGWAPERMLVSDIEFLSRPNDRMVVRYSCAL